MNAAQFLQSYSREALLCCETFAGLPDTLRSAAVLLSEKRRSEVQTQLGKDSICYLPSTDSLFCNGKWHHLPSHGSVDIFLATALLSYPILIRHGPFRLSINVERELPDRQKNLMQGIANALGDCYFPFAEEPMYAVILEEGHIVVFLRVMHGLMGLTKKSACVVFQAGRSSICVGERVLCLPAQYMPQVVEQYSFDQ